MAVLSPVDVGLVVTMVKGTIATAKTAYEISETMKHIQLKQIIMQLSNDLLDVQAKVIDMREELTDLREELKTLKVAKSSEQPMMYSGSYKFPDDAFRYCVGCYDTKGKKHKIIPTPMSGVGKCSVCKDIVPDFNG